MPPFGYSSPIKETTESTLETPEQQHPQPPVARQPNLTHQDQTQVVMLNSDDFARVSELHFLLKGVEEVTKYNNTLIPVQDVIDTNGALQKKGWRTLFKEKGLDFDALLAKADKQSADKIADTQAQFLNPNADAGFPEFLEIVALLANKEGILGPHLSAEVVKTSTVDDRGNTRIDHIVTLRNSCDPTSLGQDKLPGVKLKDVRPSVSFLVDVTTNDSLRIGDKGIGQKERDLREIYLKNSRKAEVLCYFNKYGVQGLIAPKMVILVNKKELNTFSKKIKGCIVPSANGGATITNERDFNMHFRDFFNNDYLAAVSENAKDNIDIINQMIKQRERSDRDDGASALSTRAYVEKMKSLRLSYEQVVDFLVVLKETQKIKPQVSTV